MSYGSSTLARVNSTYMRDCAHCMQRRAALSSARPPGRGPCPVRARWPARVPRRHRRPRRWPRCAARTRVRTLALASLRARTDALSLSLTVSPYCLSLLSLCLQYVRVRVLSRPLHVRLHLLRSLKYFISALLFSSPLSLQPVLFFHFSLVSRSMYRLYRCI